MGSVSCRGGLIPTGSITGLTSEGIYRKSGQNSKTTSLLEMLQRDARRVCLKEGEHQVDDVANTLKRFFRDLGDGLFTRRWAPDWLWATGESWGCLGVAEGEAWATQFCAASLSPSWVGETRLGSTCSPGLGSQVVGGEWSVFMLPLYRHRLWQGAEPGETARSPFPSGSAHWTLGIDAPSRKTDTSYGPMELECSGFREFAPALGCFSSVELGCCSPIMLRYSVRMKLG